MPYNQMTNFKNLQDFLPFSFTKGRFHRARQLTILAGISLELFYNLGSTRLSFRNCEQTKLQNPVNGNNC